MTKEPENMFGQLQFRDMYAAAEYGTANFQKIHGNPVCRCVCSYTLKSEYLQKLVDLSIGDCGISMTAKGRRSFPVLEVTRRMKSGLQLGRKEEQGSRMFGFNFRLLVNDER